MNDDVNPNRVILTSGKSVALLEQRLRDAGWYECALHGPKSREEFFEQCRALPADPPLSSAPSWDGFNDSVSGGLVAFEKPLVAIVWRDADRLKAVDPPSFILAIDVFEQIANTQWLEQKRGNTGCRVLFIILGSGPIFEGGISPEAIHL